MAYEERAHYLGAEVVHLRPVPEKGAFGGWRLGGGAKRPKCNHVTRYYDGEDNFGDE